MNCAKPKILVCFTGGTISSKETLGIKSIDSQSAQYRLISTYIHNNANNVDIDTIALATPILSENMSPLVWTELVAMLRAVEFDKYSGVIITHGTDTLAYTAAFVSVVLSHITIPIVFVSSNEPLDCIVSNGHQNFESAVDFVISESGKVCGVFVAYSHDLRKTEIYLAKNIVQSSPFINRYYSYNGLEFGYVQNKRFYLYDLESAKRQLGAEWNTAKQNNVLHAIDRLDKKVLIIEPYVGLDYNAYNIDSYAAVLHKTYHSFSMSILGDNYSAVQFLNRCDRLNIPLYFASFRAHTVPYNTTKTMIDRGARFVLDSSVELAYAKILLGHNIQTSKGALSDKLISLLGLSLY